MGHHWSACSRQSDSFPTSLPLPQVRGAAHTPQPGDAPDQRVSTEPRLPSQPQLCTRRSSHTLGRKRCPHLRGASWGACGSPSRGPSRGSPVCGRLHFGLLGYFWTKTQSQCFHRQLLSWWELFVRASFHVGGPHRHCGMSAQLVCVRGQRRTASLPRAPHECAWAASAGDRCRQDRLHDRGS